jgi:hypothetical protein
VAATPEGSGGEQAGSLAVFSGFSEEFPAGESLGVSEDASEAEFDPFRRLSHPIDVVPTNTTAVASQQIRRFHIDMKYLERGFRRDSRGESTSRRRCRT